MAEFALAERGPLAHCVTPGRHGRMEGDVGVILRVRLGLRIVQLLARRRDADGFHATANSSGAALPASGAVTVADGFSVLWAGPTQWLVVAEPGQNAAAERWLQACGNFCATVDQSDGRVIIDVAGPKARAALTKGVPVDLHPRVFQPRKTVLTTAAAVAIQLWQIDDAPTYRLAVPRSFAEGFWRWLVEAAAEYGVDTAED